MVYASDAATELDIERRVDSVGVAVNHVSSELYLATGRVVFRIWHSC